MASLFEERMSAHTSTILTWFWNLAQEGRCNKVLIPSAYDCTAGMLRSGHRALSTVGGVINRIFTSGFTKSMEYWTMNSILSYPENSFLLNSGIITLRTNLSTQLRLRADLNLLHRLLLLCRSSNNNEIIRNARKCDIPRKIVMRIQLGSCSGKIRGNIILTDLLLYPLNPLLKTSAARAYLEREYR